MKKKDLLFCVLGVILIAAAIFYVCREDSVLPLDTEHADSIIFKIYPQHGANYTVTDDGRVKEIVQAINELDMQEGTEQINRMSDRYYSFFIHMLDKDIPIELDECTISIDQESYRADTSGLRVLLDRTYHDIMRGVID